MPVLGICYGMQTMAAQLGGRVAPSAHREFGYARCGAPPRRACSTASPTTARRMPALLDVWMSHGDRVEALPPGFTAIAATANAPLAAMANDARRYYGVQFHPEVTHTRSGAAILERFVRDICGCDALWDAGHIVDDAIARVREQVGRDGVLLGLSGGVDSSVVAALLHRAIGDQLTCVFVDHGLLRLGRGRPGHGDLRRAPRHPRHPRGRRGPLLRGARGRGGPRAQAQDHRQAVHRGVRGGVEAASRA